MEYSIRENNFGDKDLIDNFNKELNSHGFNFNLPQYNKELSNENNFILIKINKNAVKDISHKIPDIK